MSKYIIQGGIKLNGKVKISGNKNGVFPCIAAALLTEEEVTLRNIPQIQDVEVMMQILEHLGVEANFEDETLKIRAKNLNTHILPSDLMTRLRGSVVLVGAVLARLEKAQFNHPGGDIIGKRSIQTHLEGFRKIGYQYNISDLSHQVEKVSEIGGEFFLDEASVTATENLILASVLGSSKVVLKNCAKEPHVVDLCNLLNQMGAKIDGVGHSTLEIRGVEKLSGTEFAISSDYIEMATYVIASAITGGEIAIENCPIKDLEPITFALEKAGIHLKESGGKVYVESAQLKPLSKLHVNIWPGFPTDLMSAFIVLATQANGVSLLHDWMYESRMFFVDKLIAMGAHITIADPHRVVVYGRSKLYARDMETPDIRAGMALVLASLVAEGKSTIHKAELIERGYANVAEKLSLLGADIQKVE